MDFPEPPDPRPRPKLARYMFERGLKPADVSEALDGKVSDELIRLVTLPFDHPAFREAKPWLIEAVRKWTRGEVGAADWTAPQPESVP